MNPMKTKNLVAKILQIYAIVNAAAGLCLTAFAANYMDGIVAVYIFVAVLLVSFGIYAAGEIIELLNQIKLNTSNGTIEEAMDDLPDL